MVSVEEVLPGLSFLPCLAFAHQHAQQGFSDALEALGVAEQRGHLCDRVRLEPGCPSGPVLSTAFISGMKNSSYTAAHGLKNSTLRKAQGVMNCCSSFVTGGGIYLSQRSQLTTSSELPAEEH